MLEHSSAMIMLHEWYRASSSPIPETHAKKNHDAASHTNTMTDNPDTP
jgi:hypothetical protein